MKKVLLSFFGFAAVLALTLTSCADACKDVNCNTPNGECVDGDCVCTAGWEGTDCSTTWAGKFVQANASTADVCTSGTYSYTCDIVAVNNTSITIINLGDFNNIANVNATLDSGNSITFNMTDGAGRDWVGTGSINGAGNLVINYTVTFDDGTSDTCTATITL